MQVLTKAEMASVTKYKNSIGSTVIFSIHFGFVMNMLSENDDGGGGKKSKNNPDHSAARSSHRRGRGRSKRTHRDEWKTTAGTGRYHQQGR